MNGEFWMSNLDTNILKLPINNLCIPGSHDSFTCDVTELNEIGPDVRYESLILFNTFGYYGKKFLKNWLITQNTRPTCQLSLGIRYFDLRVGEIEKCQSDLCITHQIFSGKLRIYLLEILEFLKSHPKEMVLLDFNHIYVINNENLLSDTIIEIFGDKIAPHYHYSEIPSLENLWKNNHQVLVFYHSNEPINKNFWPGKIIPSYWPNTTNIDFMKTFMKDSLRKKNEKMFHISQGILTPNWKTITFHPWSTLQNHLANKATEHVVDWLNHLTGEEKSLLNIVIVDFVQNHEFIKSVVLLNNV